MPTHQVVILASWLVVCLVPTQSAQGEDGPPMLFAEEQAAPTPKVAKPKAAQAVAPAAQAAPTAPATSVVAVAPEDSPPEPPELLELPSTSAVESAPPSAPQSKRTLERRAQDPGLPPPAEAQLEPITPPQAQSLPSAPPPATPQLPMQPLVQTNTVVNSTPVIESVPSNLPLSKSLYQQLMRSVFEVVVPKIHDDFIVYERPLPYERLPFKERNDKFIAIGTAFMIEKGRYVSASHLFDAHLKTIPRDYYVRDMSGTVHRITQFTRYSQYRDLAEFELETQPKGVKPLVVKTNTEIGDEVFTVGNAGGEGISVRGGQVSLKTFEESEGAWKFIRFSAPASPGNSGGPLITRKGEVVGIVVRKTENENLNFALPIDELLKSSRAQAEFYIRSLPVTFEGKTDTSSWRFNSALPTTLVALAERSGQSLTATFTQGLTRLKAQHGTELFPEHPKAMTYLLDQEYSWLAGDISKKGNESFSLASDGYSSFDAGPDQKLYMRKNNSSMDFLLERPRNVVYSEFITKPGLMLETLIRAVGWKRTFLGEEIKILSYGPPHEVSYARDPYGRTWLRGRWKLAELDQVIFLDCLPVPGAVSCNANFIPSSYARFAPDSLLLEGYRRTMQSYRGKLKDWPEFLALGPKYLPEPLARAAFEFRAGEKLAFRFGSYMLSYKPPASITPESEVFVFAGVDPRRRDSLELQGFKLQPRTDRAAAQTVYLARKPQPDAPIEKRRLWDDFLARRAPYNGRASTSEGAHRMRWILGGGKDRARMPASVVTDEANGAAPENTQVFVVQCSEDADQDLRSLMPGCTSFTSHLRTSE